MSAAVQDVKRQAPGGARFHIVTVNQGTLSEGDTVTAAVDSTVRDSTRRNHTATHLLHAALRKQFGSQVRQAGSLVAPDRLRFDFTHGSALTDDEKREIERVINEQIYRNTQVETKERSTDEAIKGGAMALFGESPATPCACVSIPGVSMELCRGHARPGDRRHRAVRDHGRVERAAGSGDRGADGRRRHCARPKRDAPLTRPPPCWGFRPDSCPNRGQTAVGGQAAGA